MNCPECQASLDHEAERCPACGAAVLSYERSLLPRSWARPKWLPWAASAVVAALAASVIAFASGAVHVKASAADDSDTPVDDNGWPTTSYAMPAMTGPAQAWELDPARSYASPAPSQDHPQAYIFAKSFPRVGGKQQLLLTPTWRRVSNDLAQGYDTVFSAVDPRDGTKLWSRPTRRTAYVPTCDDILLDGKIVCSPGDNTVVLLDRPGGDEHVLVTTRNAVRRVSVIPDGVLVLTATGTGDQTKAAQVLRVDADGTTRWAHDITGDQEPQWPLLLHGKVVLGFDSGSLVLDAANGQELTKYVNRSYGTDVAGNEWLTDWQGDSHKISLVHDGQTGTTVDGYRFGPSVWDRPKTTLPPLLVNNGELLAMKVDAGTATEQWRAKGGGEGAYCGGTVFTTLDSGGQYVVTAVDPAKGAALWSVPGGNKDASWSGCSGGDPVLTDGTAAIAYDGRSGKERWRIPLKDGEHAEVMPDGLAVWGSTTLRLYRDR